MVEKGYVDVKFNCIELEHFADAGTHNEKESRKFEQDGNSCAYQLSVRGWNDSSEPVHFELYPLYGKEKLGYLFCMNLKEIDVLIEALSCIRTLKDKSAK